MLQLLWIPAIGHYTLSCSTRIPHFKNHYIHFLKTVSYEVNLATQSLHPEVFHKANFGLKRVILIFVDNGPQAALLNY